MKTVRDPRLQKAYEASLREQRKLSALAYKLTDGLLNDQPRRKKPDADRPR